MFQKTNDLWSCTWDLKWVDFCYMVASLIFHSKWTHLCVSCQTILARSHIKNFVSMVCHVVVCFIHNIYVYVCLPMVLFLAHNCAMSFLHIWFLRLYGKYCMYWPVFLESSKHNQFFQTTDSIPHGIHSLMSFTYMQLPVLHGQSAHF